MPAKSNKLSIFLIKEGYVDFSAVASSDAIVVFRDEDTAIYSENSNSNKPKWIQNFFGERYRDSFSDIRLMNSSSKGLFLKKISIDGGVRIFAFTFGYGRHLLEDDVVEERFGLKVVLNSVVDDSIRSIDKTSFGTVQKHSREQTSTEGPASNFGIDIEQDLVGSVTGRSRIGDFGKTITGKDALNLSVKADVESVDTILRIAYANYKSERYKTNYDFIDNIEEVKSHSLIKSLFDSAINKINIGEREKIWLVPPDVIDWSDVSGFRYLNAKNSSLLDDIHINTFLDAQAGAGLTLEKLREQRIHLISASTGNASTSWAAIKCIYAEVDLNGSTYILNCGKWYKIEDTFVSVVNKTFNDIPEYPSNLPDYDHENEGEYNKYLSHSLAGSACLDADFIHHGGGHSKFEFCDVLTVEKDIIHVKRYGGASQLSHLFAQAVASAQLFVSDRLFREKLNDKLPVHLKLSDTKERPSTKDYRIVYAVISNSKKPLDIPFFAKITLRNAARVLTNVHGFNVYKKKIVSLR